MELAASYLRGMEISIQEIAYVTGYADPCNFHRSFSCYRGMTANAYRQQHQIHLQRATTEDATGRPLARHY